MPLKSQAQIRKWGELVEQGKITKAQFDEALAATPTNLPERLSPKKSPRSFAEIKQIKKIREIR